jgi:hypothetical protein
MADIVGTVGTVGTDLSEIQCRECGATRVAPVVCAECGTISDIPTDAFAFFGLSRTWSLDPAALEERYGAIARAFREKSASRDDARARVAGAVDALESARRQLLDPIERARLLLASYGAAERDKPVAKREFQTAVMEIDAAASKARREGDSARLTAVALEAEEKLASAIVAAGQSFTRLERALVDEVGAAADALAEARLWRRKVDELRTLLAQ